MFLVVLEAKSDALRLHTCKRTAKCKPKDKLPTRNFLVKLNINYNINSTIVTENEFQGS